MKAASRSFVIGVYIAVAAPTATWSLSLPPSQQRHQQQQLQQQAATTTRRAFGDNLLMTATAAVAAFGIAAPPAKAYERRDVGGANMSPETAAFNIQAYETNNRLEREGLKLETQAEQQASLTAALAEYSYSPSSTSINSKTTKDNSNKNPQSKAKN